MKNDWQVHMDLRAMREEAGLSQTRLAELSGLGFQTFRYCESCELWAKLALYALKLREYPIGALDEAIAEKSRGADGSYFVNQFRV